MDIFRVAEAEFRPSFGVHVAAAVHSEAFALGWLSVEPGSSSEIHYHDELELFVVVHGNAVVCDGAHTVHLGVGDVVRFPPFGSHVVKNLGDTPLLIMDLYWRDSAAAQRAAAVIPVPDRDQVIFITSTPPTPNGDLHLGHLSGPYLGADVYCRYLRMRGVRAYHISGSDDFQSYVIARSNKDGSSPKDTAQRYSDAIEATLAAYHILPDYWAHPSRDASYMSAQHNFFKRLIERGIFTPASMPATIHPKSGAYLYEVDVRGGCPACGLQTNGNICESCGQPNHCVDLKDPKSSDATDVEIAEVTRLEFDLGLYSEDLKRHGERAALAPRLRRLLEEFLERDSMKFAVSHPGRWGIAVPGDAAPDQVIWVWCEMLYGFFLGMRHALGVTDASNEDRIFPGNSRVVHFFGFDNAFYHTILFPALVAAAYPGQDYTPDYVYNEFLLLDGDKFSTSRDHAIWGRDFLKSANVDGARFVLAYERAEFRRTNFSWSKFRELFNHHLVDNWNAWLVSLGARVTTHFDGVGPDAGLWSFAQVAFLANISDYCHRLSRFYNSTSFSLNSAAHALSDFVIAVRDFSVSESHLAGNTNLHPWYRTSTALELCAARTLALLAAPLMPEFSDKLWRALGGEGPVASAAWPTAPGIVTGRRIQITEPFFVEIPDIPYAAPLNE